MNVPDRLVTIPPISRDDLVIVGPDLEQAVGRWATTVPLEMDDTATAVVTVNLVEQEYGEILDELSGFFRRDPTSGVRRLKKWNTLRLHDTSYVLSVMRRTADGMALDFYDEASEDLKRYFGPIKWSRSRFTRAQGIKGLANEAGVRSYIPDRDTKQPIADLSKDDQRALQESQKTETASRFDRVYPAHFIDQTAGRVQLTPRQVRAIAESAGLPGLAFEQIAHGEAQYYPGIVQRDPGDGNVGYGLWQITPHAWGGNEQLLSKLKELGGTDGMRNPVNCAAMAKFMFDLSGLGPWVGTRYLTDEARREAETRQGSSSDSGGTADRAYVERFEFAVAAHEDYWDATERFASDVRWRRFTAFNHLVYASDFTLAALNPYALNLDEGWIDDLGDWQVSRDEAIDEIPISGRLEAIVPPGTAFAITDDHPLYGTWLNRNFQRDLLDEECNVKLSLTRPEAPLPEPASKVRSRQTVGDGGASSSTLTARGGAKGIVDQIFAIAKKAGGDNLFVGSELRPGSTTTTGSDSDHGWNDASRAARDIGDRRRPNLLLGPPTPALDRGVKAVMDVLGATEYKEGSTITDPATGKPFRDFHLLGYRIQVIYRTPAYGGHMGHLHAGARRE